MNAAATERDQNLRIVVAATFTADPLQAPMQFWIDQLGIAADVVLAPYAQVIQALLDNDSAFSRNEHGYNVLLIRVEDWISARLDAGVEQNIQHALETSEQLVRGVEALRSRTSAPTFIFLCPSSSALPARYTAAFEHIQEQLRTQLSAMAHTHCWTHADLLRLYPLANYEDAASDRLGHIPFTPEYFTAIATLFARRIAVLLKSRYKVIAVDCDNTLWKGVCGEDGPAGVELTPAHAEFQRMLIRQHDAGMLLCLCTKNNPSDVEAVFSSRADMPLRMEHFVFSRINWEPKSANLQYIGQELDLALDSFIFVDDSGLECAEVRAHCPAVLTLQFPQTAEDIAHFMAHTWAFDRLTVTAEAKRRTEQYKETRARNAALASATDLDQFLASLALQIDIATLQPRHLNRVAELVQRTNQFNLTGIRRSASELERLIASGELQGLVIHVKDKFGDYGLVGAVLFRYGASSLDVDTFVLSCRALGRKVEHRIIEELGRISQRHGLPHLALRYRRSARNAPACNFLETCFNKFRSRSGDDSEAAFLVSHEYVQNLSAKSHAQAAPREEAVTTQSHHIAEVASRHGWHEAAYRFSRLPDLLNALRHATAPIQSADDHAAPRTRIETTIATIWADVLGLENDSVSVDTDFFRLGGNSVSAVRTLARIESTLGLELSVFDFFEDPTVAGLAAKLTGAGTSKLPIPRVPRDAPIPLSGAQQRLWFIDRLEGSNATYHIPVAVRLRGRLDPKALHAALNGLMQRHEILRTRFTDVNAQPIQEILPSATFALKHVDVRELEQPQREAKLMRHLTEEFAAPFKLSTGPLIRGLLIRAAVDEHALLITMHHIISDAWSSAVLLEELGALYEACRHNLPDTLPSLPIQYADYAHWQQQWIAGPDVQEQLEYWKKNLEGSPELLELPTDRPRPAVQSYRGATVPVTLGPELVEGLKALSQQHGLTVAMPLYAAWLALLSKLSRQEDIVLGMPVANRRRAELEGLIGFFVNTLALRVRLERELPVTDLLQRVKSVMVNAFSHEDVPFEEVVRALRPTRSLRHAPIFQVMFAFQNVPRKPPELSGLTLQEQTIPLHMAHFDLTLSLQESEQGITGALNYATDLFDEATISRWIECFKVVLRGIAQDSQRTIAELPYVPESERRLLSSFNATHRAFPQDKLIHELFEEQARRTPHATAVISQDRSVTFDELNSQANQLAHHLRIIGVRPDRLVGICMERSVEVMIGILGVLKAGGAYVPLDPDYPAVRLQQILEDAAPFAILLQSHLRHRLPATPITTIALDTDWHEIAKQSDQDLESGSIGVQSHHLAYTLFTSGSTGRPKGVMIEHRNVLSLWQGLEAIYAQSRPCKRIAVNASLSFDASVKQFIQLLSGRTVVMVPQECRWDPTLLLSFVKKHRVDGIDCTPLQLKSWLSAGLLDGNSEHRLRVVLVGGEPIDAPLWRTLAQSTYTYFYNVYGPTESTVDTTYARLKDDAAAPHIGRPMENRQVHILGPDRQLVPIGVPGEIYIGGAGVARGYLNRASLTQERFLPDPFASVPLARMYKSGDLARWREDGTIEYLGRNDDQVKIRGYRIELEDIEAQLKTHEQVRDAAVIARDDARGEKRLLAYVTPRDSAQAPTIEKLQRCLKATLPEYMVPAAFVILQSLPVTANGKLDKRALPAPDDASYLSKQYEPPLGEAEEIIAAIWRELLSIDRVGREDNFFELGGHSLMATQVVARIEDALSVEITIRQLFESPTVRQLAAEVDRARQEDLPARLADGNAEMEQLLEQIAAMSQGEVKELLDAYSREDGA